MQQGAHSKRSLWPLASARLSQGVLELLDLAGVKINKVQPR